MNKNKILDNSKIQDNNKNKLLDILRNINKVQDNIKNKTLYNNNNINNILDNKKQNIESSKSIINTEEIYDKNKKVVINKDNKDI